MIQLKNESLSFYYLNNFQLALNELFVWDFYFQDKSFKH